MKRFSTLLFVFLIFGAVRAQEVIDVEFRESVSAFQLNLQFFNLLPIEYGVDMYKVTYTTDDIFGQPDTASGLLIIPDSDLIEIYPTMVFQHGTVDGPDDVPSNLMGGHQLGMATGGIGYVTLMPDYLGMGEARGFHPYVHAESEASAAVDMVRAIWEFAPDFNLGLNDQIFISGYSQGGHASMALHQEMELNLGDEFTVTAGCHMSGPYSISGEMVKLILSDEAYGTPAYLPNTFLSFNYVYDIYDSNEEVFKADYVPMIESYFNNEIGLFDLNDMLIAKLTADFGSSITKNMLQDSIVTILEEQPEDHPIIMALRDNDVYDWAPEMPTRIMYCTADDQVVYTNSIVADTTMNNNGATDVASQDVSPNADHGACVIPASLACVNFFSPYQVITDIDEIESTPGAVFYPNPAQSHLYLKGVEGMIDISVSNLQGQQLFAKQIAAEEGLSLDGLARGMYLVRAKQDDREIVDRVIVH